MAKKNRSETVERLASALEKTRTKTRIAPNPTRWNTHLNSIGSSREANPAIRQGSTGKRFTRRL